LVATDWRDQRIAELEGELARRDAGLAARDVRIAQLEAQVAALTKQVAELLEIVGRNSRNSHLPPSTDPPGTRGGQGKEKGKPGKRKRGGQPGHGGCHRVLLPPERVDEFVDLYPSHCEGCARELPEVADPCAKRFQQTEMPPVRPHTKEWRCHEVGCPSCGHRTRAPYDATQIPASAFGPRLMALIALVTGVYHLSRRKTTDLVWELCGVRLSLGALSRIEARVSDALEPAVAQAWKRVGDGVVKHTDGTSWVQAGAVRALWTIATKAATVFKIVADNSKRTLEPLYGSLRGILVSDRAKALNFWAMERRQICWAHLLRKFVSFSERVGSTGTTTATASSRARRSSRGWRRSARSWRPRLSAPWPRISTASRARARTCWSIGRPFGRSSTTRTSSPPTTTPRGRSAPSCSGESAATARRAIVETSSPSA
jgi:transposase